MVKTTLLLGLGAAALVLGACSQDGSNEANAAPAGDSDVAAGEQPLTASLEQDASFLAATRAVGLDATLAGGGPYTVLVPSNDAFAKAEGEALKNAAEPENRAEITRILTYHILPGVILAEDIDKAIEAGTGKAVLTTMGGGTLTATKEDGAVVLTDGAGGKARVGEVDKRASNGVIHRIDTVLMPGDAS